MLSGSFEFFQRSEVSPWKRKVASNGALGFHKRRKEGAECRRQGMKTWTHRSITNSGLEVEALEVDRGVGWRPAAWATAGLIRNLLSTIGASDKNHVVKLIVLLSQPQAPMLHPPGAGASTSPPCSTWTAGPAHVAIAAVCWASKASARAWACARAWASPSACAARDAPSAVAVRRCSFRASMRALATAAAGPDSWQHASGSFSLGHLVVVGIHKLTFMQLGIFALHQFTHLIDHGGRGGAERVEPDGQMFHLPVR